MKNVCGSIVNNPNLSSKEREVLGHVFIHFFSQRFQQISIQQIQKMIKHLTPIEKTLIGKQLIEIGREEGREEGRQEGVEKVAKNLIAEGEPDERIARLTGLSLAVIANLRKRLHSGAGD